MAVYFALKFNITCIYVCVCVCVSKRTCEGPKTPGGFSSRLSSYGSWGSKSGGQAWKQMPFSVKLFC